MIRRLRWAVASLAFATGCGAAAPSTEEGDVARPPLEFDRLFPSKSELQAIAADIPELLSGNTLAALEKLRQHDILTSAEAEQASADYVFLRRVEHYMQIYEDRQVHALPSKDEQLDALAKRVMDTETDARAFMHRVQDSQSRIREAYERHLTM